MSENNSELLAQLQGLLGQVQASPTWNSAPKPETEIAGVSIPLSLDTPKGKLRVYLSFPGATAANPEAFMSLVQQLDAIGMPLDFWSSGSGWSGNGVKGGGFRRKGW
jgi:hypothetical protein